MIKIKYLTIIILTIILFNSINVYATNELSKSSIDYTDDISEDTNQSCQVCISIPYKYSEIIPKDPPKPVQTGDENNISLYVALLGISIMGMCGVCVYDRRK